MRFLSTLLLFALATLCSAVDALPKYFGVVQNRDGRAQVGVRVLVTINTTGAVAPLFADDEVTGKGNPLTTDANGAFEFKVASGVYDITTTKNNQSVTQSHITISLGGGGGGGGGSVSSVALSLPNIFTVTGSPVTTSGILSGTLVSKNANTVFAGPVSGSAATPAFRALVPADLPLFAQDTNGVVPGPTASDISGLKVLCADGTWTASGGGGGGGSVTSVALSVPAEFSVAGSPLTTAGTIAVSKATQARHTGWFGPTSGSAAAPAFRQPNHNDVALPLKLAVKAVLTANRSVASPGGSAWDGVSLSLGDRALLTGQTDPIENGIWVYVASGSPMTRPDDWSTGNTVEAYAGVMVYVLSGTAKGGSEWMMTTGGTITIDTDATAWSQTTVNIASGGVTGALPLASGGTGLTSPGGGGQVLMMNGAGTAWQLGDILSATNGGIVTGFAGAALSLSEQSYQSFSNANAVVTASQNGNIVVAQTGTMSAPRTLTLCAASAVSAGTRVYIVDESGTVTSTNTISVTRAGSDTINGATSLVLSAGNAATVLESDHVSKWTAVTIAPLPGLISGKWLTNDGTSTSWGTIATTDISGFGSMGTQSAGGVAITGGTLSGITSMAQAVTSTVTSGTVTLDSSTITANPASATSGVYQNTFTAASSASTAQNFTATVGLIGGKFLATHGGTGTVTRADAAEFQVSTTNSSGTVTAGSAVHVFDGSKAGGTTMTTLVGVDVDSQTAGTTNYAIRTGAGLVQLGGNVYQKVGQGWGVTSTATAAGTTVLTTASTVVQVFTGATTQTITLPAANAYGAGVAVVLLIKNRSSGSLTVNRAGSDTIDGITSATITTGNHDLLVSDGVSDWTIN